MDWIRFGPKLSGLDWVGLRKLDACPTQTAANFGQKRFRVLKIVILPLRFFKMWGLARNFVFLNERFATRK